MSNTDLQKILLDIIGEITDEKLNKNIVPCAASQNEVAIRLNKEVKESLNSLYRQKKISIVGKNINGDKLIKINSYAVTQ